MKKYSEEHIDITDDKGMFIWIIAKQAGNCYSLSATTTGFPSVMMTEVQLLNLHVLLGRRIDENAI